MKASVLLAQMQNAAMVKQQMHLIINVPGPQTAQVGLSCLQKKHNYDVIHNVIQLQLLDSGSTVLACILMIDVPTDASPVWYCKQQAKNAL